MKISKYKNVFAKGCTPDWFEEVFVIKKVKNAVPWTYVISDLNGKEIVGSFYVKDLQKASKKEFRIEFLSKRKGYRLNVKWKEYGNSFNYWINMKNIDSKIKMKNKNKSVFFSTVRRFWWSCER